MESFHEEKAVEYYSHNFNFTQGVFTAYAIEHGFSNTLPRDDQKCGQDTPPLMKTRKFVSNTINGI